MSSLGNDLIIKFISNLTSNTFDVRAELLLSTSKHQPDYFALGVLDYGI